MLGKRVQVVGMHPVEGEKPPSQGSLFDKSRVCDFPPVYLDEHAADIRLVREVRTRVCKQCGCEEETTWAGPDFFCTQCRKRGRYRS